MQWHRGPRSLSSYWRWWLSVIAVVYLLAIVGCMIYFLTNFDAVYTDFKIIIKSIPEIPIFKGYSYQGEEALYTLPGSVSVFWDSGAKLSAILYMSCSIIFPFVIVVFLFHLFLSKSFEKYKLRTHCIFFFTQSSKLVMLAALVTIFLGVSTSIDVFETIPITGIEIEYWIKSGPTDGIMIYFIFCTSLITCSFGLLIFDQWAYYHNHEGKRGNIAGYAPIEPSKNKNSKKRRRIKKRKTQPDEQISHISTDYSLNPSNQISFGGISSFQSVDKDNNYYILAFCSLTSPKSISAIICRALYLAILVASMWIVLESFWTVSLRFTFGGFAGYTLKMGEYATYDMLNDLGTILYLKTSLGKMLPFIAILFIVYIPILTMGLIILIWFIPLKKMHLKWIVRLIIVLAGAGIYDTFLVAVLVSFEMKELSIYIVNQIALPRLCGDHSPISEYLPGGCFYGNVDYVWQGLILIIISVVLQWFHLGVTIYNTNKNMGIYPIRFT
eukprot:483267_1